MNGIRALLFFAVGSFLAATEIRAAQPAWIPLSERHEAFLNGLLRNWEKRSDRIESAVFQVVLVDPQYKEAQGTVQYSATKGMTFQDVAPNTEIQYCVALTLKMDATALKQQYWVRVITPIRERNNQWLELIRKPTTGDDSDTPATLIHILVDAKTFAPIGVVLFTNEVGSATGRAFRWTLAFETTELNLRPADIVDIASPRHSIEQTARTDENCSRLVDSCSRFVSHRATPGRFRFRRRCNQPARVLASGTARHGCISRTP